jgi:hypothetical protein
LALSEIEAFAEHCFLGKRYYKDIKGHGGDWMNKLFWFVFYLGYRGRMPIQVQRWALTRLLSLFTVSGPYNGARWSWRIYPGFIPRGARFQVTMQAWSKTRTRQETSFPLYPGKQRSNVKYHYVGNPQSLSSIEINWRPPGIPANEEVQYKFSVQADLYGDGSDCVPSAKPGLTTTGRNHDGAPSPKSGW